MVLLKIEQKWNAPWLAYVLNNPHDWIATVYDKFLTMKTINENINEPLSLFIMSI